MTFATTFNATFVDVVTIEEGAFHCTLADGERVTVLVASGEPRIDKHSTNERLCRVVRSDGTVIVDDVVTVRVGGPAQRRIELLRRRLAMRFNERCEPEFVTPSRSLQR